MPNILCYLDTCISPFAFKSNFCFSFCFFFSSICFMMVKIPHGDTSSYSITQARNQEPSPHSLDHQLLTYLLPKQLSDLAFIFTNTVPIISHCNTAVVSLLPPPPLLPCLISQWQNLPVACISVFFCYTALITLQLGVTMWLSSGQWEVSRRVMWQFLGIFLRRQLVGTVCPLLLCPYLSLLPVLWILPS